MSFTPADKLIVALDGMDRREAIDLVVNLPDLKWVKVGLELFTSSGPAVLDDLRNHDVRIFLDLKFHDIPATMANSCYRAAKLGADLITVHACAGLKALSQSQRAVIKGAADSGLPPPALLAVTVLTSWDQKNFTNELLIEQSLQSRVDTLANLANQAGISGLVCSPWEVSNLRKRFPEPFELVTPGIRLKQSNTDDQARVVTPSDAINLGASRLVIGRPITTSDNPQSAFNELCSEMQKSHFF